jgi:hypothetical protein
MTIQQAAQRALDVQDACNLSGVAYTFSLVMDAVCDDVHARQLGTKAKNTHPVVTMFLLKMAELNGCGSTLDASYGPAEAACKAIVAGEAS